MPRVPKKVVPTFSEKEVEALLRQPDKRTDRGFRDYALLYLCPGTERWRYSLPAR